MCPTLKVYRQSSESRKIRKPLMEKKRRARINDSLNELKNIILKNTNEVIGNDFRPSKLEKADILEKTVEMIKNLIIVTHDNFFNNFKEILIKVLNGYENMSTVEKNRFLEYMFNHPVINKFKSKRTINSVNVIEMKQEIWRPW